MEIKKYIWNGFLLLLPVFLWNIMLIDYLPESYSPNIFGNDLPNIVGISENILRFIVFALPLIMVVSIKTRLHKIGFSVYIIGLMVYFLSWLVIIIYPESNWSQSLIGFMAPAFTTIILFAGIGLIGNRAFFKFPYLSHIYIVLSILFVIVHSTHAYIIFQKL